MIGMGTVDEFVRAVLEEKANLIDQLVEGAALPADLQVDVMGELRRVMGVLEPRLAALSAGDLDEAKMQELLDGKRGGRSEHPRSLCRLSPWRRHRRQWKRWPEFWRVGHRNSTG